MVTVKALVVAGGGSGSLTGGGAGGLLYDAAFTVTQQVYGIVVGAGGAAVTADGSPGNDGVNSSFSTMVSDGGGGGAPTDGQGRAGGSGGGSNAGTGAKSGGAGTVGQGNDGGTSLTWNAKYPSGAGGGAGAIGGNGADTDNGGVGGAGTSNSITGSAVDYAGGGGGNNYTSGGNPGAGGTGGGGAAADTTGVSGTTNLGGGGGGTDNGGTSGAGGSGVVIFSYVTADFGTCTGGTKTIDGVNTVHTFTSSGNFTVVIDTIPVTAFSGTPLSGNQPLTVEFTDASTGTPTSWAWTFGDGKTSTEQSPSNIYDGLTTPKETFTVSLTATNAIGSDTETKTGYIEVTGNFKEASKNYPIPSAIRGGS